MQTKKLHISEYPIKEFKDANPTSRARRVALRGKPVGLWYALGLEWVDRMQKVLTWEVTGERENFPYTRAYYNKVATEDLPEWLNSNSANNINEPRARKGAAIVHYVYDLTFDKDLYSEDIHAPSKSKVLKVSPKVLEQLYTEQYLPVQETYMKGILTGVKVEMENILGTARFSYYLIKNEKAKVNSFDKEKKERAYSYAEVYAYVLHYLSETDQLTKLMKKRYKENAGEVKIDTEKYVEILVSDLLKGKFKLMTHLYDIYLRVWGSFWETVIERNWGGVEFTHALFEEDYMKDHPEFASFLTKVEIPSGCLFKVPSTEPNLALVLAWSMPNGLEAQVTRIKNSLSELYTEEQVENILKTRTYVAVPTKKGEIKFLHVPAKVAKDA